MSTRETADSTSQSGVSYPAGSAGVSGNVKNVKISLDDSRTRLSKLGSGGAFNGHAVIVSADNAVWDTVSGKYLYPSVDYNPGDIQRT